MSVVHFKALAVILVLSLMMLILAKPVATELAIRPEDYKRRAFLWLAITLAAFFSRQYWIYVAVSASLLMYGSYKEQNKVAAFFFLLFTMPPFPVAVPGFGIFGQTLIYVDHLFWVGVTMLVPCYFIVVRKKTPGTAPIGSSAADKFVLAYAALQLVLQLVETSLTNVLRLTAYIIFGGVLHYFVASRALRNMQDFRDALMSFMVAVAVSAPVAVFEMMRHWLLYSTVPQMLSQPYWGLTANLSRGGDLLRSVVTSGQPIVLGFVMQVGLVMCVFLSRSTTKKKQLILAFGVLTLGLIAALSRGPWVGAAASLVFLMITGPNVMSKLSRMLMVCVVAIPVLAMTPYAAKMVDYLPFVGTVDSNSVDFRSKLLEVSLGVIGHYPWFGSLGLHEDMEQMRGSDGIIDVVNTYIFVALRSGLVGLTLFLMPTVLIMLSMLRSLFVVDKNSELHLLGRCLLATIIGTLVTVGTVSSIVAIPVIYWSLMGLGMGYLRLVAQYEAAPRRQAAQQPQYVSPAQLPRGRTAGGRPGHPRATSP